MKFNSAKIENFQPFTPNVTIKINSGVNCSKTDFSAF